MQGDHKPNFLIVDNDDRILWKFQELLEGEGLETCATWSGREALAMLRSGAFDVLLVDDYLPDLHSHDFLERVAHLPCQPSIVVMQNTPPRYNDREAYLALGVSDFVNKNDSAEVCRTVTSCCDQSVSRKVVH